MHYFDIPSHYEQKWRQVTFNRGDLIWLRTRRTLMHPPSSLSNWTPCTEWIKSCQTWTMSCLKSQTIPTWSSSCVGPSTLINLGRGCTVFTETSSNSYAVWPPWIGGMEDRNDDEEKKCGFDFLFGVKEDICPPGEESEEPLAAPKQSTTLNVISGGNRTRGAWAICLTGTPSFPQYSFRSRRTPRITS